MFVEDWRCIVPSEYWNAMVAGSRSMCCTTCREVRTTAAELRQKEHIMATQLEAYEASEPLRTMREEMMLWGVEAQHETQRAKLEAAKVG